MRKNYVKPICQNIHIENDNILAGVKCGETVIIGASMKSTSSFEICYHDKEGDYSLYSAKTIKICGGHQIVFDAKSSSDSYNGKHFSGWENSDWSNGDCHFIGDIYVDGKRITKRYSENCND